MECSDHAIGSSEGGAVSWEIGAQYSIIIEAFFVDFASVLFQRKLLLEEQKLPYVFHRTGYLLGLFVVPLKEPRNWVNRRNLH